MTATVGEAFLMMRNHSEEARLYKAAVACARAEKASHESTWIRPAASWISWVRQMRSDTLVRAAFPNLHDGFARVLMHNGRPHEDR
jgi:hypothetical protein